MKREVIDKSSRILMKEDHIRLGLRDIAIDEDLGYAKIIPEDILNSLLLFCSFMHVSNRLSTKPLNSSISSSFLLHTLFSKVETNSLCSSQF